MNGHAPVGIHVAASGSKENEGMEFRKAADANVSKSSMLKVISMSFFLAREEIMYIRSGGYGRILP